MSKRDQLPVAVRKAIAAGSAQLAEHLPSSLTRGDMTFTVRLVTSSELSESWKDAIWKITERNMRDMSAESSMGWDPDEKSKELFHENARFIILSFAETPGSTSGDTGVVVGFSMFQFDYEEGETLLYCYEVQLVENFRQLGLGKFLVRQLLYIGKIWKMEKAMLTVLKANTNAARFYRSIGFVLDSSSPDYVAEGEDPEDPEDSDYEILSIDLLAPS